MDVKEYATWVSLILGVIAILGHFKGWTSAGEKPLDERLKKVEGKLIDHDRRIQSVEGELEHLPSKEMVFELKLAITELRGTVGTLGESVASISRTVHRIDDYLREEAK